MDLTSRNIQRARRRIRDLGEFAVSGLAGSPVARMVAQHDLLQEMDGHFSSISAHVATSDEAEVDGLGALTGLWSRPQALEVEPDALAKQPRRLSSIVQMP